jgi:hypothetical protein
MFEIPGLETKVIMAMRVCSPVMLLGTATGASRGDDTGRQLRLLYEIDAYCKRPASPLVSGPPDGLPQIQFDIRGRNALNYPGTLYLTGGWPGDTYSVNLHAIPLAAPHYEWHGLSAQVQSLVPYAVPDYHSRIRGVFGFGSVTYTNGPAIDAFLSDLPAYLSESATVILDFDPSLGLLTIQTEWYG